MISLLNACTRIFEKGALPAETRRSSPFVNTNYSAFSNYTIYDYICAEMIRNVQNDRACFNFVSTFFVSLRIAVHFYNGPNLRSSRYTRLGNFQPLPSHFNIVVKQRSIQSKKASKAPGASVKKTRFKYLTNRKKVFA